MSDGLRTRYAKTTDGGHVAYQILGDSSVDVLVPSYGNISIAAFPEEPHLWRFCESLHSFARLIFFDWRGIGLSDPLPPDVSLSMEQRALDALEVCEAVESERPWFMAWFLDGPAALSLAARHGEKLAGLVLINTSARFFEAPGYECGLPMTLFEEFDKGVIGPRERADDSVVAFHAPSMASDQDFVRWWNEAGRKGASPTTAHAVQTAVGEADAREYLALVKIPTLILQHRDTLWFPPTQGRFLADHIPEAKYVELPGQDTTPFTENAELFVEEIEDFLTGERHVHDAVSSLAAVVFTDIVGSTHQAAQLGDRRWHELLESHNEVVRRNIERYRGRNVKFTGDGVLAIFPSPVLAIRFAFAARDGLFGLGLEIRVGIHVGQIELRHSDIGGVAVHIGQRILAIAAPGEVLVSGTVKDLVLGTGIEFAERGEHDLKGVPGSWRLFAVTP